MLLAIDVGNSHTVLGLFEGPRLRRQWRVATQPRTADELGLLLLQLLALEGGPRLDGAVVGTVVPSVLRELGACAERYLGCPLHVVDVCALPGLPLRVDRPQEVGPDRVINLVAALAAGPGPVVVVDFGTATTVDAADADGAFVGGAIAPGLGIVAEALSSRTSRLPRVELRAPPAAIGRNTVHAMQSGLVLGYVGLVDGLVARIRAELGGGRVLATGGLAGLVAPLCAGIDAVEPDLTLHGLRLCHERRP